MSCIIQETLPEYFIWMQDTGGYYNIDDTVQYHYECVAIWAELVNKLFIRVNREEYWLCRKWMKTYTSLTGWILCVHSVLHTHCLFDSFYCKKNQQYRTWFIINTFWKSSVIYGFVVSMLQNSNTYTQTHVLLYCIT